MKALHPPRPSYRALVAVFSALYLVVWVGVVVVSDSRSERRLKLQIETQEATTAQLRVLSAQIAVLEDEKTALATESERARAQANTSVDQLVKAGEKPIISAPEVVSVPTDPLPTTTTTQPPVIITVPVPETTTTTEPATTITTTTTTEPPVTEPPTTESTTTTTTSEGVP